MMITCINILLDLYFGILVGWFTFIFSRLKELMGDMIVIGVVFMNQDSVLVVSVVVNKHGINH